MADYQNPKRKLLAALVKLPNEELVGNELRVNKLVTEEDYFTLLALRTYKTDARETIMGLEEITRNIPNVSEEKLLNLDERGIIKIGSKVKKGDLIVGKISPKAELTPEEKFLREIFGEKPVEVYDDSLKANNEDEGTVVDIKYTVNTNLTQREKKYLLEKKKEDLLFEDLPPGVKEKVKVYVGIKKELKPGDVLQDSKENKGVVTGFFSKFFLTGTPIEIVASPHSDFASSLEDYEIKSVWKSRDAILFRNKKFKKYKSDDYMGEAKVGYITLERLTALMEEKITARSIGPYSIVSQQPVFEGSSKGAKISVEEISALKGYPALVKEALTLKSDDFKNRIKMYESLVKNGKFNL
jgi:DNA-directed RNA polymerase subunit beta